VAILFAVLFDGMDGRAARATRTTSRFGMEYDSLADLVSFGVAPALLIYSWALSSYGRIGWAAAFLFLVCGALRLARFNTQPGSSDGSFIGLPIPAAAAVIAATVLLDHHILRLGKEIKPMVIVAVTYVLAGLMVSQFRYRGFKNFQLGSRKPFRVLVSAVIVLIIIVAAPQVMLFLLAAGYALSGVAARPIRWAVATVRSRRRPEEPAESEGR
jgi:CDP-diacylglycerol--serine O-phosphatidyltransferase